MLIGVGRGRVLIGVGRGSLTGRVLLGVGSTISLCGGYNTHCFLSWDSPGGLVVEMVPLLVLFREQIIFSLLDVIMFLTIGCANGEQKMVERFYSLKGLCFEELFEVHGHCIDLHSTKKKLIYQSVAYWYGYYIEFDIRK